MIDASDIIDTQELARLLGVTPSSLRTMRAQAHRYRRLDGLPAPFRAVNGQPVWRRADIEAWMQP